MSQHTEVDKEVRFDVFCETCKHNKTKETEEPCNTCLESPSNAHTSKPVKWEEK